MGGPVWAGGGDLAWTLGTRWMRHQVPFGRRKHQAAAALEDPGLAVLVERLASSLPGTVLLAIRGEYLSPAEAGEALGVSCQYIDKLIVAGRLAATTKPGSTHRLVTVADLLAFERIRRGEAAVVADIVDELIEAGVE